MIEISNSDLTIILLLGTLGLFLAMVLTPIYTYFAYRYKFWKKQREDDVSGQKLTVFSKLHAEKFKRNIPTMAGVVFVLTIALITFIFNLGDENNKATWLPLAALIAGATMGLIDDLTNLFSDGIGKAGLRPWIKFSLLTILGLIFGWWFFAKLGIHEITIPFFYEWDIGFWMIPLFAFIVVATGNAVNITDGLDGLAGGLAMFAFAAFGVIALLQGNTGLAGFCFTVVGALTSYVWFNIYPARFFMGDVGSFALGTSLGVIAMLTDSLFFLPVIAGVFVVEAGSSLLQILSKKFRNGKRIFKSAPLHQHLQAIGWPEVKVTMRFWVIGIILASLGVILALEGGIIG